MRPLSLITKGILALRKALSLVTKGTLDKKHIKTPTPIPPIIRRGGSPIVREIQLVIEIVGAEPST